MIARALAMSALSAGAIVLAFHAMDGGVAGSRGRVWQGLVVLGVALLFRAAWELYELDGLLAASAMVALASGGVGLAAWSNVATSPELATRAIAFGAVAVLALAAAAWRIAVRAREG